MVLRPTRLLTSSSAVISRTVPPDTAEACSHSVPEKCKGAVKNEEASCQKIPASPDNVEERDREVVVESEGSASAPDGGRLNNTMHTAKLRVAIVIVSDCQSCDGFIHSSEIRGL